jgi:hypothetical protein
MTSLYPNPKCLIRSRPENTTKPQSNEQHDQSTSNNYRKVVESVVLMNKLTVERAQQESEENPTEKRTHYDSSLQRWHAGSDDTAIWLYNLVFVSGVPSSSSNTERKTLGNTLTVTVEDYSSDVPTGDDTVVHVAEKEDPTPQGIAWNEQTDPSVVVDRLLDSWTTLTGNQVQDSRVARIAGQEETWGAELVHTLTKHNAKKQSKKMRRTRGSRRSTPLDVLGTIEFHGESEYESAPETLEAKKDTDTSNKWHSGQ